MFVKHIYAPCITKVIEAENVGHSYIILRSMFNAHQDLSTHEHRKTCTSTEMKLSAV